MFLASADELALHDRVLAGDPIASLEVFTGYIEPLVCILRKDLTCDNDIAYDSAVDTCFAYLEAPARFESDVGRLCTYLVQIAKNKAVDRLRSMSKRSARDAAFANVVELGQADPMEQLMDTIRARELWEHVEANVTDARDRAALRLIFEGESATEKLAEALGLGALQPDEQRQQVKRGRDRLIKTLERLGKKLTDE